MSDKNPDKNIRTGIKTNHEIEIPDEIAFTIPMGDPLRERLKTDEEFARLFISEFYW